ncbi:MAG: hypothetical protein ACI4EI_04465 [Muricoprocola sp.]
MPGFFIATDGFSSCSLVVNEKIGTEEEIEALIKNADKILYSIKEKKKGTYAFF